MSGSSKDVRCFEALKEFAEKSGDRNQPPFFAGREHILAEIENACEDIWQQHRLPEQKDLSGRTRVIYGAPGAGKSSTLKHLRDAWNSGEYITHGRDSLKRSGPTPVMMYSGDGNIFNNLNLFCRDLLKAAAPDIHIKMHAAVSETVRKTGGLDAGLVKGGIEKEKTVQWYIADASLKVVAEFLPGELWTRPVVICVDEAQSVHDDERHSIGNMLKALHANDFNLPVLVVLGGLSNTRQRAAELGLSRLARDCTRSLECLNAAELEELKKGFCGQFKIELGEHASWFDDLIGSTEGWPAHIQNALLAFARDYVKAQGDMSRIDFSNVEEQSHAARLDYYRSRRSPEMKSAALLVGAIMQKLTGRQEKHQVIRMINSAGRQCQMLYGDSDGLPSGMTATDLYDNLIHRGALQERDDDTVICPIPSFRQFLIEKLLLHEQQEQNRHARDVLRHRELPDEFVPDDLPYEHSPYLH